MKAIEKIDRKIAMFTLKIYGLKDNTDTQLLLRPPQIGSVKIYPVAVLISGWLLLAIIEIVRAVW